MGTPVVKDRQLALWAGIGAICLGSWLLYDAYDARDRRRPFALRFLPGA